MEPLTPLEGLGGNAAMAGWLLRREALRVWQTESQAHQMAAAMCHSATSCP